MQFREFSIVFIIMHFRYILVETANAYYIRLVDPGDVPRSMDPASRVFGLDAIEVCCLFLLSKNLIY